MPLLILAPMYNVTDSVFRQMISYLSPPDLYMTEFVNVDGLQSRGRTKLLPFLYQEPSSIPLIAQIWGTNPENYYQTAKELASRNFAGIDINMGCPDKTVIKNNNCSALIKPANRPKALEIIRATQEGAGQLPVSVKTRLGFNEIDLTWHQFLLEQNLDMLTIHGRTTRQKSLTPADYGCIGLIKQLANDLKVETKIIGNGDIVSRDQALALCSKYSWDGAMIGRGIFANPLAFSKTKNWSDVKTLDRLKLYYRHLELFQQTYKESERSFQPLKKFMKVYLTNFNQASNLRLQIAQSQTAAEAKTILKDCMATI